MKSSISLVFFMFISTILFSLEVDRNTLNVNNDVQIEFDNYVGPHLFYNTVEEIRSIGSFLASGIVINSKTSSDYQNKYLMFHKPNAEWETDVIPCDVFQITSNALVDNVNNIELILSQYLIENYGYSLEDADLIARLLLIYNATYRGNAVHYSSIYTSEGAIADNLEYLGIDVHYYNWPGQTYLYIPLSNNIEIGQLANIDTDKIIDENIIDIIKVQEEDNITFREEIIDFKERELDEENKKLQDELDPLIEKKDEIDQELLLNQDSSELLIAKTEVEEQIKNIEEKVEEINIKEEKILELRDDLAVDKNAVIEIENNEINKNIFKYIVNRNFGDDYIGQLVNISETGKIVDKGSVNSIRNNFYLKSGGYIYVIAGGESSNQLVTLGKIDSETLSLEAWGDTACNPRSTILLNKGLLYVVIKFNDKYYIGEFDNELTLIRRSPTAIFKDSYIVIRDNVFYIQGEYSSIKWDNLSDFVSVSIK